MDPVSENSPTQSTLPNDFEGMQQVHISPQNVQRKRLYGGSFILLVLGVLISALVIQNRDTSSVPSRLDEFQNSGSLSGDIPRFAEFVEDPITVVPSLPETTISRSELTNLPEIENEIGFRLSEVQLRALESRGFFATPATNYLADGEMQLDFSHGDAIDEFVHNYYDISGNASYYYREPQDTVLITSDFLLHSYHVFVDKTFEYVEKKEFYPKLLELTSLLYEKNLTEYNKQENQELKQAFERNSAYYLIAKVLLESVAIQTTAGTAADIAFEIEDKTADSIESVLENLLPYKNDLSPDTYQKVRNEIELIMKSEDLYSSPLYGNFRQNPEDYTQYKPRSHYEKNSMLRSYWRAMIWYGRNGFLTSSDELTLDALLQTSLFESDPQAITLWESIYHPTVFFVGKSDDLTFYDYSAVLKDKLGTQYSFELIRDEENFAKLKESIKNLQGPQIQSSVIVIEDSASKEDTLNETKSFRFMGQRFIPDSYIYSTLTQGDEEPDKETGQSLPSIPTALMTMSILGSDQANEHLDTWIRTNAPDSNLVIEKEKNKLQMSFSKLTKDEWTKNMYWAWLYTLSSQFQEFPTGYPQFMRSHDWLDKELFSALGSYAELRHDTLLYAKQSYAELGGGGGETPELPPVPKGYVEPNIVFLNRLIALARMTRDGLESSGVLPDEQKAKIESLISSYEFFRDIAVKELQNEIISDEEFEKLRVEVRLFNSYLTPPDTFGYVSSRDTRAGIVADIHTAVTDDTKEVLYQATGIPNILYVAVKDINGTRLTRGVTYSYYEFTHPFGERISDSDWQGIIYEGKQTFQTPELPFWINHLYK